MASPLNPTKASSHTFAAYRKGKGKGKVDNEYLFKMLLMVNFLEYIEAGAIPALLLQISDAFKMNAGQLGILGGIVFVSISLGGPVAAWLLRRYDHGLVVGYAVTVNNFISLIWALTPVERWYSIWLFIFLRALMGFTQACLIVFLPLFTNEFAPSSKRTRWMSFLQASVPLGIIGGYILGTVVLSLGVSLESSCVLGVYLWRWPFIIECILLIPISVLFFVVPKSHINVRIDKYEDTDLVLSESSTPLPNCAPGDSENEIEKRINIKIIDPDFFLNSRDAELGMTSPDGIGSPDVQSPLQASGYFNDVLCANKNVILINNDNNDGDRRDNTIKEDVIEDVEGDIQSSDNSNSNSNSNDDDDNDDDDIKGIIRSQLNDLRESENKIEMEASDHLPYFYIANTKYRQCIESFSVYMSGSKGFYERVSNSKQQAIHVPKSNEVSEVSAYFDKGNIIAPAGSPLGSPLGSPCEDDDSVSISLPVISYDSTAMRLLSIPLYRSLLFCLVALYFTVTGVQYWGTTYFEVTFDADAKLVRTLFILVASTGPTIGVVVGGAIIDRIGGYKNAQQRVKALEACCVFGLLACAAAISTSLSSSLAVVVVSLWFLLFFGACVMPALAGMLVTIVPRVHRPSSTSLTVVAINLCGNAASLLISGWLMEIVRWSSKTSVHDVGDDIFEYELKQYSCDRKCSLQWGFRVVLSLSIVSVVFLSLALRSAYEIRDRWVKV